MLKSRINLTLDADLLEFVKEYAESQRTTVSEVFTQFVLELKRVKENYSTDVILADPDFTNSLFETTTRIKNGAIEWFEYDKVFE
jgi:hypothetical protein